MSGNTFQHRLPRSTLGARLARLESKIIRLPYIPPTKAERDELVRAALADGDMAALCACETKPERRVVIEAAFRADS